MKGCKQNMEMKIEQKRKGSCTNEKGKGDNTETRGKTYTGLE